MGRKRELNKPKVYAVFILLIILIVGIITGMIFLYNLTTPLEIFFSPPETISGSDSVNDTYIYEGTPTSGWPQAENMFVGTFGLEEFRSLIQFDISSIPSGDYIIDAKLNISVASVTCPVMINISRINNSWDQDETTWNDRDSGVLWDNPEGGGDHEPGVENSTTISSTGNYSIDITDLVDYWYQNPGENLGLMMYPGDNSECLATMESTQSGDNNLIPKLDVVHVTSLPPQIGTVSSDAQTLPSQKSVGENVTFSIAWDDDDNTDINLFICNTSQISTDGCAGKTFCNSSEQPDPATCQYSIIDSDNRTSKYYAGVCDGESCSISGENIFYMNHPSEAKMVIPNGGELIDIGTTSYLIQFNVSDEDRDNMVGDIYWGPITNLQQNLIAEDIALTFPTCTDADTDKSTPNNCTYDWDPSEYWQDDVYITVYVNDTYFTSNDSSDGNFDLHGLEDPFDPWILNASIPSTVYSGEDITISAWAGDDDSPITRVWASINTTPITEVDLTLYEGTNQNGNYSSLFTGIAPGSYKVTMNTTDTRNNYFSYTAIPFTISGPEVSVNQVTSASTTLPYNVIRIFGDITPTTSLKGVYARLNVPNGFRFLNETPVYQLLGDVNAGEQINASWFVSVPLQTGDYTLNITYSDQYSNNWTTTNTTIQVTSNIGSGTSGYSIEVSGFPETIKDTEYYVDARFKQGGIPVDADSVSIILQPFRSALSTTSEMNQTATGTYNHSYTPTVEGNWLAIVNATKDAISYYGHQFFKVIGALFDIGPIGYISRNVDTLNISIDYINEGSAQTDLKLNITLFELPSGNRILGTNQISTFAVLPGESGTFYYAPTTTYYGQARIEVQGGYGVDFAIRAGAADEFIIEYSGTTPPGNNGGNNGNSGGTPTPEENETETPGEGPGETPGEENETTEPGETPGTETTPSDGDEFNYWILIIILLVLLIIIMIILIFLIYRIYKKQSLLSFLEKGTQSANINQNKNRNVSQKIQAIERKLKE